MWDGENCLWAVLSPAESSIWQGHQTSGVTASALAQDSENVVPWEPAYTLWKRPSDCRKGRISKLYSWV